MQKRIGPGWRRDRTKERQQGMLFRCNLMVQMLNASGITFAIIMKRLLIVTEMYGKVITTMMETGA